MMTVRDWGKPALIAGVLFALTLIGFFFVPGHTYLQSDTQIYIPIFERIENPDLYSRDFLLSTAHIGLTLYDETAIWLRHLTGSSFDLVLAGEQIVFRALALWGVFLIATSLGFKDSLALLVAACYGLGATIVGPAVLSVEYEPVPRGFAVPFLLLATGLLMHGRYIWACSAASVGFLYHSPATIPFWILFAVVIIRERRWRALWPLAASGVILAIAFTAQRTRLRPQPFWTTIDPSWEQVIRMRTTYDWIGMWPSGSVLSLIAFCALAIAALWRIRALTNWTQRIFLAGFPLVGIGSIAVSALLLDHWKWALMAQVQPARATLFTIVFAQINCAAAGLLAARERRWWETFLWFVPVMLPPVRPLLTSSTTGQQVATVMLLALICTALVLWKQSQWLAAPVLAAAACWAIPHYAHTVNYPELHSSDLDQLSDWARTKTPTQALFVFPNSGHNLDQGVFRVRALRSLYVDWKAGGQGNYFRDFALDWNARWNELSSGKLTPVDWRARGVEYLVYAGPRSEQLAAPPVFENKSYRAYQTPPIDSSARSH